GKVFFDLGEAGVGALHPRSYQTVRETDDAVGFHERQGDPQRTSRHRQRPRGVATNRENGLRSKSFEQPSRLRNGRRGAPYTFDGPPNPATTDRLNLHQL